VKQRAAIVGQGAARERMAGSRIVIRGAIAVGGRWSTEFPLDRGVCGKEKPMRSFQHLDSLLRVYAGAESLQSLGRELDRLDCRRAVIFCGSTLARSPMLDVVRNALGDRCAGVFGGVKVHSPIPTVLAAADELKRLDADAAVAVGGGSVIVTARAASIALAEGSDIASMATSIDANGRLNSPKLLARKIPQFVVPTTPTTASVKAGSAIFDIEAGKRRALFDPKTRAQAVFVHPELIIPVPSHVVIGASLNTLVMALEGLASGAGNPFSDALLMHALRLCVRNLEDPVAIGDPDQRGELILAAVMCGKGTDQTGAGMALALGHAIGTRHEIDNGLVNAIVLPFVMKFNAEVASSGYEKAAAALNLAHSKSDRLVAELTETLGRLFRALNVPPRLRDAGVPQDALSELARLAMEDWFLRSNPRPVQNASEIEAVLQEAW
jgi:alcohol dehydrogenase class IV